MKQQVPPYNLMFDDMQKKCYEIDQKYFGFTTISNWKVGHCPLNARGFHLLVRALGFRQLGDNAIYTLHRVKY